jgi:hypothetical protein
MAESTTPSFSVSDSHHDADCSATRPARSEAGALRAQAAVSSPRVSMKRTTSARPARVFRLLIT